LRLVLDRNVVGTVAEIVDLVIAELVRRAVCRQCRNGGGWLSRAARAARGCSTRCTRRFRAAGFLALVLATAAWLLTAATGRTGRLRHAHFRALGLHGAGVEAHQVAVFDPLLGHPLDALEQLLFVRCDQRDGFTAAAGTAGATNAVHIVF